MTKFRRALLAFSTAVAALLAASAACFAADGVVEINRLVADAGGVSEGDTPGFPVTLDRSGSYRLSGDLRVVGLPMPAEITVIEVTADNVEIDLNGFIIDGATRCTGAPLSCSPIGPGRGIDASSATNVTVLNGTVRGMGNDGIALGRGGVVRGVRARENGGDGVQVGGGGLITECLLSSNGAAGAFVFGPATLLVGNVAGGNGGDGIHVRNGATIEGNTATINGGDGIEVEGEGGAVRENVVWGNSATGILASDDATGMARNLISMNDGAALSGGSQLGINLCGNAPCP